MFSNNEETPPVLVPYNPLDKRHLGEQVADQLLAEPIHPLPPEKFIGAGVYAIYYRGDFPAYVALSDTSKTNLPIYPIYVGKAIPDGARKGGQGVDINQGFALYKRLRDHAKSIDAAVNLKLSDFCCRFLAVDDIWIPLAETTLIERFKPIWNCLLEGFGNHAPGRGRQGTIKPLWDSIHPGRAWANELLPGPKSAKELQIEIVDYLEKNISIKKLTDLN